MEGSWEGAGGLRGNERAGRCGPLPGGRKGTSEGGREKGRRGRLGALHSSTGSAGDGVRKQVLRVSAEWAISSTEELVKARAGEAP